jgi:D-proline reductase (dithiol) PrdB
MSKDIGPLEYIPHIREKYSALGYKPYQWFVADKPTPMHALRKPLSECRIALAASGGIYQAGQRAFHFRDDTSFRMIPKEAVASDLRVTHFAYDLADARRDPNLVFPVKTLCRLESEGVIGKLVDPLISFMGGIYSARRVREELAPSMVRHLSALDTDALLLVPVTPVCHQTVGLIARYAEEHGISTVCLSNVHDVICSVKPPRAAFVDFPMGYAAGKPGKPELQCRIIRRALNLLKRSDRPGRIEMLPFKWDRDDLWKHNALKYGDQRRKRTNIPQYQCEEDRRLAENASNGCRIEGTL